MILSKIRAIANALLATIILGSIGMVIWGFGLVFLIDVFATIFVETKSSSLIDPMVVWLSIFIALPIIYYCGYVLIVCYKTFFVDVDDHPIKSSNITSKIGLGLLIGFLGIAPSTKLILPILVRIASSIGAAFSIDDNIATMFGVGGLFVIFVIFINILDYYSIQQSTSPSISET